MTEKGNRILHMIMAGILLVSMFFIAREGAAQVSAMQEDGKVGAMQEDSKIGFLQKAHESNNGQEGEKKLCVVVDAGHGGKDPGKVGINGELEKDINLEIASMLEQFLKMEGIEVVMTRKDDMGLYDENASNKKVQDMKRRLEIIENTDPVLVVSIHQNSYSEESVKGAQVFYYSTSEKSKQLATILQKQIKNLDVNNKREAKGNDSYFLLKKTAKPIVIVECGFLSNAEDAGKLTTPLYQEKMAWNIYLGIMQYLNYNSKI